MAVRAPSALSRGAGCIFPILTYHSSVITSSAADPRTQTREAETFSTEINRRALVLVLSCASVCGAAYSGHVAAAEQRYPTKPIRIIIPTTPGGGSDQIARSLGQKFTTAWGQQVVIDHRAGAGQ